MEKQTPARLLILEEQVARLIEDVVRLKTHDTTGAIEAVVRAWIPKVGNTIVEGLMPVFIQKIQELEKRVEELEKSVEFDSYQEAQNAAHCAAGGFMGTGEQ